MSGSLPVKKSLFLADWLNFWGSQETFDTEEEQSLPWEENFTKETSASNLELLLSLWDQRQPATEDGPCQVQLI